VKLWESGSGREVKTLKLPDNQKRVRTAVTPVLCFPNFEMPFVCGLIMIA